MKYAIRSGMGGNGPRVGRIGIITPGQLGSNPRVVKEANTLHMAGYDVFVIATRVMDIVETRDRDILDKAPWQTERIAFDNAIVWKRERLIQELARLFFRSNPSAHCRDIAVSAFARRLSAVAVGRKADFYIAHYVAALPAAARAARKYGVGFAFDAEDFHSGERVDNRSNGLDNSLIEAVEDRYLPMASYVSAASVGIADAYSERYKIPRPTVIRNVFSKSEAPNSVTAAGTVTPGPSLYWFSQVRGPGRGLDCAVEAIARARTRPHLYLRGAARPEFDAALLETARTMGCADRIHFLDPEAPSEMVQRASCFDAGLVAETGETLNRRIALTNKQFTYLLAGIPVVLSDIPAHQIFSREAQGAAFLYRTGDADALTHVLDQLFSDSDKLKRAREIAFALGQAKLNWETEESKLLEVVNAHTGLTRSTHSKQM